MTVQSIVEDVVRRSGLSKAELARRSGISRSSLDEYLLGKRQPSVAQLERLGESAGFRLDLAWTPVELRKDPSWLIPNNPDMQPRPTTTAQRAQILERVVVVATELRRRERGELEFPPFKVLAAS
ncbi:hypothetical protein Back2_03080 [Nocardioides baekrokdamisoli]|uniref:HTH cro/C1-type domain-containing protein n=1 Tax=Nocardioides baekrokdamisoli TaxID=1804624 RepID=A0A3G9IQW2_9ACTN|nr:helix-turn-helix transcriptional regulator [Nocardioides baekrokdamisoli]BBH16021.1 hypothetical protein Back2_03080 [Nocardioides baekrokdamisoli]